MTTRTLLDLLSTQEELMSLTTPVFVRDMQDSASDTPLIVIRIIAEDANDQTVAMTLNTKDNSLNNSSLNQLEYLPDVIIEHIPEYFCVFTPYEHNDAQNTRLIGKIARVNGKHQTYVILFPHSCTTVTAVNTVTNRLEELPSHQLELATNEILTTELTPDQREKRECMDASRVARDDAVSELIDMQSSLENMGLHDIATMISEEINKNFPTVYDYFDSDDDRELSPGTVIQYKDRYYVSLSYDDPCICEGDDMIKVMHLGDFLMYHLPSREAIVRNDMKCNVSFVKR